MFGAPTLALYFFPKLPMNKHLKFWNEQLSFLKGRTIVDAYMDVNTDIPCREQGVPVLLLDNGTRFLVVQDEEGNAPGSFFYEESKPAGTRK